ncbi:MAG: DNA-binding response regulator [Chloroflexi bacterium]|nr:MAG: DNA-binding response regulator [Chloroflexota bacterium]
MPKARILIIDDEKNILELITAYLDQEDFEYKTALDGESGLDLALSYQPDLIVLDIMLPGLDGIELLTRLRRESDVYVILLTARGEETDKIIGLSVGADDYLSKPFSPRELVARIKAALRRIHSQPGKIQENVMVFPGLRIDLNSRQAWKDDQLVDLTTTEYDILHVLADHSGMVLSREQLLDKVWGFDYYGEIRVVDVHVGHLRKKIGGKYIATVRGVGYRFDSNKG